MYVTLCTQKRIKNGNGVVSYNYRLRLTTRLLCYYNNKKPKLKFINWYFQYTFKYETKNEIDGTTNLSMKDLA